MLYWSKSFEMLFSKKKEKAGRNLLVKGQQYHCSWGCDFLIQIIAIMSFLTDGHLNDYVPGLHAKEGIFF